jgi:hypothetical protein
MNKRDRAKEFIVEMLTKIDIYAKNGYHVEFEETKYEDYKVLYSGDGQISNISVFLDGYDLTLVEEDYDDLADMTITELRNYFKSYVRVMKEVSSEDWQNIVNS